MKPNTIMYALRPGTSNIIPVTYADGEFYYGPSGPGPGALLLQDRVGQLVAGIAAEDVHLTEVAARKALVARLTDELDRAKRFLSYSRTRKKELRVQKTIMMLDVPLPLTDLPAINAEEAEAPKPMRASKQKKEE